MTANEIYKWPHTDSTKEIYVIMDFMDLDGHCLADGKNEHVEIRCYIDHNIDGERYIEMSSVWFKNKPVMIFQKAGRGGRDHREFYITDGERYRKMVKYVRSLLEIQEDDIDVLDPNKDHEELTNFYGISALELYDPDFVPQYKVGDIVMAKVIKDHLRMAYTDKEYVETRCRINSVKPKSPCETYHMAQLDRRWENEKEMKARGCTNNIGEMIFDKGRGGVGAVGDDTTILYLIEDGKKI